MGIPICYMKAAFKLIWNIRFDRFFLSQVSEILMVVQVEFYFSDENLPTDKFLLKYVKKDKGFG